METHCYIELPVDKHANIGYRHMAMEMGTRGYVVIEAYQDGSFLTVTAPDGFKWPSVNHDRWAQVDHVPGSITDSEYARLVLGVGGLLEWMYDAVRSLMEENDGTGRVG